MSFWGWFRTPKPVSFVYPHAIVNVNVPDDTFARLPKNGDALDGPVLAASDVLRDVSPPRPVFFFSPRSGVTEALGALFGHEVSHVMAKLQNVPDLTHDTDGGRLA